MQRFDYGKVAPGLSRHAGSETLPSRDAVSSLTLFQHCHPEPGDSRTRDRT